MDVVDLGVVGGSRGEADFGVSGDGGVVVLPVNGSVMGVYYCGQVYEAGMPVPIPTPTPQDNNNNNSNQ